MTHFYHDCLPPLLEALCHTPAMERLKDVGMHCGCEYTAFPRFLALGPYSRYTHSLGVGLITWHFTEDPAQAAAALLHDVATPTFAHTVDFLRGDYLTQEATEAGTRELIAGDAALCRILDRYGLTVEQVCDYHQYPIADNDSPRLSADRLEYTLGNLENFGFADRTFAERLYRDIVVGENEEDQPELVFRHGQAALDFALGALRCARVYVCPEDRYSMQRLSEVLALGLQLGVIGEPDLYGTEPPLIRKLLSHPDTARAWEAYRALSRMEQAAAGDPAEGWRVVPAKKRCIDPLIKGQGRVTAVYPAYWEALDAFLGEPQTAALRGS